MRKSQPLLRSGLAVAAAAALPLALAAVPAAAGPGISVSTSGSTVSVTTTVCSQTSSDGSWGTASLLNRSQATFAQGRQVALSGTTSLQSAAWQNVSPGTYTVVVRCAFNDSTAGTQSVIVSAASTPTISATASPSRGVMGGLGGATRDYGTLTLAAGGVLVGTGALATAWFLRRRSRPYRL
ncbi:hypothetical protein [Streptomyces dysideae]|uniref:Secreted protein n=1 Tax=Streptomyces dysideae TaxID=909626 RepID=A0A101UVS0_9ACTN|nr:hypothetical protein [Streptomyces dysideae]KUO17784.1 hypothetical protein AQJ91_29230 [Streptomyces dysideae]